MSWETLAAAAVMLMGSVTSSCTCLTRLFEVVMSCESVSGGEEVREVA